MPDIMLFNNADNDYSLGYPTNVVVSSNGKYSGNENLYSCKRQ